MGVQELLQNINIFVVDKFDIVCRKMALSICFHIFFVNLGVQKCVQSEALMSISTKLYDNTAMEKTE